MSTLCVGPFAKLLASLTVDRDLWRAKLMELPTTCDKGCRPGGCRSLCAAYAHVQLKCVEGRK